jgi:hypothetical protein
LPRAGGFSFSKLVVHQSEKNRSNLSLSCFAASGAP